MKTASNDFLETTIPTNNTTITLNVAGNESTMRFEDLARNLYTFLNITLQKVTDKGNTTTNDIELLNGGSFTIKLSTSDGVVYSKNSTFALTSPAAVGPNTLGVDTISKRLFFKNNLNQIIYIDDAAHTLTFGIGTGNLLLTTDTGDTTSVSLDGRYVELTSMGQPNGVAPLDGSGIINSIYLPGVPINNTFVVADITARLALAANIGNVAVQTNDSTSYVLQNVPASNPANWVMLLFPASVTSVNGQTGPVTLTTDQINQGATNKYASSTTVNPLIENYLGRGIFLLNNTKYQRYNTIEDAIAAYSLNDLIFLNNVSLTITTPIVITNNIQIQSLNSFITSNSTTAIFTDNGVERALYIRGQLYLRNSGAGRGFHFTNPNSLLYLDGDFDFRDTKTVFNLNGYYYIKGVQTQVNDVLNFNSGSSGNLIGKGVGIINYNGGTHNLTGVATTLNLSNQAKVTVYSSKDVYNVLTTKATLKNITLNNSDIVLHGQQVSNAGVNVENTAGNSTLKAYNSMFVQSDGASVYENMVVSGGNLIAQLNNCGLINPTTAPLTLSGTLSAYFGYSYGNQPILGVPSGAYLVDSNFTSPIL